MESEPSQCPKESIETDEFEATFVCRGVNYSVTYDLVDKAPAMGKERNNEIELTSIQNQDTYEDVSLDSTVAGPLKEMAQADYDARLQKVREEHPELMEGDLEDEV